MKKLTFEEKREREKKRRQDKIAAMPIIGMAAFDPGLGEKKDILDVKFRLQVVKLSKHRVTMRTINGRGLIEVVINDGREIQEVIPIEMMPCDTTPSVTRNGVIREIPQGSDVPL